MCVCVSWIISERERGNKRQKKKKKKQLLSKIDSKPSAFILLNKEKRNFDFPSRIIFLVVVSTIA